MKILRLVLIALAAPAAILLGVHEIGGTPIAKGYDTGFTWRAEPSSHTLALTLDTEGGIDCWLRLKMLHPAALKAETSRGTHLHVERVAPEGEYAWVTISKEDPNPAVPFNWPAGVSVLLEPQDNSTAQLMIADWEIYPSNKQKDSLARDEWRKKLFHAFLVLLSLALIGAILEAIERVRAKDAPPELFSAEYCLKQLIARVEGDDDKQSEQMRTLLRKVLIEGVDSRDAVNSLQLSSKAKELQITYKAPRTLYDTLDRLVRGLAGYHQNVQAMFPRKS
jgi:hypothetical protein